MRDALGEYIDQMRKWRGLSLDEFGRLYSAKRGNKVREGKDAYTSLVSQQLGRAESVSIKVLRDMCDVIDCDVEIKIIPR